MPNSLRSSKILLSEISVSEIRRISDLKRKEEGFTLIEVLAAVTIFSFLIAMACSLFIFQTNFYQFTTSRLDVQQNVRIAADYITQELRYATTMERKSERMVEYQLPDDDNKTFSIRLDDKNQIIRSPNIVSYNIESLHFTWDDVDKVLTFTIKGSDKNYSYTLVSAVYLPNAQ